MDTFPHEWDRPDAPCLARALCGDQNELSGAFLWDQTWQGHRYWSDRAWRGEPLTPQDKRFLLTLMFFQIGKELADARH